MTSLGIDIGGANTKAVLTENLEVKDHWMEYIPLWERGEELRDFLSELSEDRSLDSVGVTMTGELSDAFESKREGVRRIVGIVSECFGGDCRFMSLEGDLLDVEEALESPMSISAANWVASGLAVGKRYENCLLIDVGSTTTDIIPIKNGTPVSLGSTDFERLRRSELVYTGILRTPLSYLVSEMEVQGRKIGIAAEYFANMADVYRVLDLIEEGDYTCDTPDGRGKSERACMKRIARVFCSDVEELGEEFLEKAAERFYEKQVSLLSEALKEVSSKVGTETSNELVLTGIGRKVLAERAAEDLEFGEIIDLEDLFGVQAAEMTPAYAVSLLAEEAP